MKSKLHIFLFTILFLGLSCGDDGEPDVTVVPEADRNEQQVIDNDSLLGYLQTHYINSSFLINNQKMKIRFALLRKYLLFQLKLQKVQQMNEQLVKTILLLELGLHL